MAATYYTYSGNDYTAGTAGATDFPLVSSAAKAISYLQPSHIHVYISTNQGASWTELSRPSQWNFVSSGTVARLTSGIANGAWVRIKRITPNDGTYVTFQSGSLLTAEQLNDEASSNSFVNQETSDLLASTLSEVQAAQQAIESAIAAVGGLTAFTQVANVAAIPTTPANGTAVEVQDSTGIQSFSPLAGVPAGFTGDSGLTARIIYSSATTSWLWFGYGVKEPDARYARLSGAVFTGAVTVPAGSTVAGYAPLASPTFTGTVTIPAGASISGYETSYAVSTTAISKTLNNRERCTVTAPGAEITLPPTPLAGDEVNVTIAGGFTNTLIKRNGQKIMGLSEDLTLDKGNASISLYYVDSSQGWRII